MGAILCPRKNRRSVDEYTGTTRSDQTLVGVGRGRRAGTRPIASSGLPGVAQHGAPLHGGRASRSHPASVGARQRGLSEAGGCPADELAESRALFRSIGAIDAADSGGFRAAASLPEAGG